MTHSEILKMEHSRLLVEAQACIAEMNQDSARGEGFRQDWPSGVKQAFERCEQIEKELREEAKMSDKPKWKLFEDDMVITHPNHPICCVSSLAGAKAVTNHLNDQDDKVIELERSLYLSRENAKNKRIICQKWKDYYFATHENRPTTRTL